MAPATLTAKAENDFVDDLIKTITIELTSERAAYATQMNVKKTKSKNQ